MARTIDKGTLTPAGATRLFGDEGGTTGNFAPESLLADVRDEINLRAYASLASGNDWTAAMQAAHDALPDDGGVILVPRKANGSRIDLGIVSITKPNVSIRSAGRSKAKIRKSSGVAPGGNAAGGAAQGAIFQVRGLQPANFVIEDLDVDLNRSAYTDGDLNALVFGLRSTYIDVRRCDIAHSAENALKFLNCANLTVDDVRVDDIYNNGIEINANSSDGASGLGVAIPTLEYYSVSNSKFCNVNDGKAFAGNGVAVALQSSDATTRYYHWSVVGNEFEDNLRDIHCEFANGAYLRGYLIAQNRSYRAKCGSIATVLAQNGVIAANRIYNAGDQSIVGTSSDTYGVILTSAGGPDYSDRAVLSGNLVSDDRASATAYTKVAYRITSVNVATLAGNIAISPPLGRGIHVVGVQDTLTLHANTLLGSGGDAGIAVAAVAGRVVLGVNTVYGYVTNYSGVSLAVAATDDAMAGLRFLGLIQSDGAFAFTTTNQGIRTNTADSSDSQNFQLCGGGGFGDSRGAYVRLYGNEASGAPGVLDTRSGNVTGSYWAHQAFGAETHRVDVDGWEVKTGWRAKRTTVADTAYTILKSDHLVAVTSLTAPRTLTLPAAASNARRHLVVKDESGAAGTYAITIDGNGAETVDGAANVTIGANYGAVRLYCNGTAWFTE